MFVAKIPRVFTYFNHLLLLKCALIMFWAKILLTRSTSFQKHKEIYAQIKSEVFTSKIQTAYSFKFRKFCQKIKD